MLWSLDLDRDGWPVMAHEVVSITDERAVTACGLTRTRFTHPRGWWETQPGELPLAEHAIHCRAPVAGVQH